MGRSGSRYLNLLLSSHNSIITYPEPTGQISRNEKDLRNYFKQIFSNSLCVGCKVKYLTVWKYGIKDFFIKRNFKIIHLKRANILDHILSKSLGEKYGWYAMQEDDCYKEGIHLDASYCLKQFKFYERSNTVASKTFSDLDCIEVFYEDLVSKKDAECKRILDFIYLPYEELTTTSIKQRKNKKQSDLILNYWQLKEFFVSTQWGHYFID